MRVIVQFEEARTSWGKEEPVQSAGVRCNLSTRGPLWRDWKDWRDSTDQQGTQTSEVSKSWPNLFFYLQKGVGTSWQRSAVSVDCWVFALTFGEWYISFHLVPQPLWSCVFFLFLFSNSFFLEKHEIPRTIERATQWNSYALPPDSQSLLSWPHT